ncbi:hypothetical protein LXL04_034789 [Taraxacum kok-saghyz]
MARRVSDYRIRRIADRGNEEDGPDSRACGDRFYRNRRSADRGNEKVDRDPGIIYDYPPVYDEYEDEEWYYWMIGAGVTYDPTGYVTDSLLSLNFGSFLKDMIADQGAGTRKEFLSSFTRIFVINLHSLEYLAKSLTCLSYGMKISCLKIEDSLGSHGGIIILISRRDICWGLILQVSEFIFIRLPTGPAMKTELDDGTTKFDGQIRGIDYVFDPGGWFLKLSKLEDEFFQRGGE